MPLRTKLNHILGIGVPIVQAPIGSASCAALAAAVSEAGGLGTLALTWEEPPAIRAVLDTMARLTRSPFAVNLVLAFPVTERLHQCLDLGVKIVSSSWGDPAPLVGPVHDAGGVLIHQVGSAAAARRAVDAGVDVIVAQGWEAGGHVESQVGTIALVPRVVDAVTPTPVIAGGGIADGRGIAAALMLGAAGVWMGTRFLASEEASAHHAYQQRLLEAGEQDTIYTSLFDLGWPNAAHRVLRNRTVEEWQRAGMPPAGFRPFEGEPAARRADGSGIPRYSDVIPRPGMRGDIESLALYAGQGVGLIDHVLPARAIVARLEQETLAALEANGSGSGEVVVT